MQLHKQIFFPANSSALAFDFLCVRHAFALLKWLFDSCQASAIFCINRTSTYWRAQCSEKWSVIFQIVSFWNAITFCSANIGQKRTDAHSWLSMSTLEADVRGDDDLFWMFCFISWADNIIHGIHLLIRVRWQVKFNPGKVHVNGLHLTTMILGGKKNACIKLMITFARCCNISENGIRSLATPTLSHVNQRHEI